MALLREEAFVDSSKIESVSGLTYGVTRPTKHPSNPLLTGTAGTYQHHVAYTTAVKDPTTGKVMLFYGSKSETWGHGRVSLAMSDDGVIFTKPNLGLFTLDGNTVNNCVLDTAPVSAGGTDGMNYFAFVTYHEGVGYVAVGSEAPMPNPSPGHWYAGVYTSPDGISWTLACRIDTNLTTRDAMSIVRRTDGRWIIYMQSRTVANVRSVGYWISDGTDLATTTWTGPVDFMLTGPSQTYQYYSMHAWRDGEVFYAAMCIYNSNGYFQTPPYFITTNTDDRQWKFELWTSRADDGLNWTKIDNDWLYSGTDARNATLDSTPGEWDYGCMIGGGAPVRIDDEWFWYYGGAYEQHHPSPAGPNGTQPWQQRKAGAALIPYRRLGKLSGTGTVVLDPIAATEPASLTINSVGTVEAELLDAAGSVIAGYARSDCDAIPADTFDHVVTWNGNAPTPDDEFKVKLYLTSATVHYVTVAGAEAPVIASTAAADVTETAATITGTVDPRGYATTYHVEYGETTSYGSTTSPVSAGAGSSPVAAEVNLSGLAADTAYHARLVATSAAGTTYGPDIPFTTDPAPLPDVGLTIDSSAVWEQDGTTITARALTGRRTVIGATAYSAAGGPIWGDGDFADRFDVNGVSLDGMTSVELAPATLTSLVIGVTPLDDDDELLTVRIGIPE